MKFLHGLVGLLVLCLYAAAAASAAQPSSPFSSTYVGGEAGDGVGALALGDDGSIYVAGETSSATFPASERTTFVGTPARGSADAFVAKLAPGSTQLEWVVVLGGSDLDSAQAVAVTSDGVFVAGYTLSEDFPTASPALDPPEDDCADDSPCDSDGWLAEVTLDGSSVDFSTYVGGSRFDQVTDIVARRSTVFVAGRTLSEDLPRTDGWRREPVGGADNFVLRFSARTRSFTHGTYVGGGGHEGWPSLDLGDGTVVVGTSTLRNPARGPATVGPGGAADALLVRLGRSLASARSTRIGGSGEDSLWDVAVTGRGRIVLAGTTSSRDFPTVRAFQSRRRGPLDGFVASFDVGRRRLRLSSYVGGSDYDFAWGLEAAGRRVVVVGETRSEDFPTRRAVQPQPSSGGCPAGDVHCTEAFVTVVGGRGALRSSTFFGGSRFDSAYAVAVRDGAAMVAGLTHSPDLPGASSPQPVLAGPYDGFLAFLRL